MTSQTGIRRGVHDDVPEDRVGIRPGPELPILAIDFP